jgi:hypothetical protein
MFGQECEKFAEICRLFIDLLLFFPDSLRVSGFFASLAAAPA